MMQRSERTKALEEAIRHLESVKIDPDRIGELDFEDARVDGMVATALSAARAALSAAATRDDLAGDTHPNP